MPNQYENEKGRQLGVTMKNIVTIKPYTGKDKVKIKIEPIFTSGNYSLYLPQPIPKNYEWGKNRHTIKRKSKSGNSTPYVFATATNSSHSIGHGGSLRWLDDSIFPIGMVNRLTENDLDSLITIAIKRNIKVRNNSNRNDLEMLLSEILCSYCLTFKSKCYCK